VLFDWLANDVLFEKLLTYGSLYGLSCLSSFVCEKSIWDLDCSVWKSFYILVLQEDLYYPHPFVQDVLWATLHKFVEPVMLNWPGSKLREKALETVMQHVHYEDENTQYICIASVNKVNWGLWLLVEPLQKKSGLFFCPILTGSIRRTLLHHKACAGNFSIDFFALQLERKAEALVISVLPLTFKLLLALQWWSLPIPCSPHYFHLNRLWELKIFRPQLSVKFCHSVHFD